MTMFKVVKTMKYLNKLSIFNLWEKEKVDIDFFENVTFLTGYNGSGKSTDRKSTRLNSSHSRASRMPSSA